MLTKGKLDHSLFSSTRYLLFLSICSRCALLADNIIRGHFILFSLMNTLLDGVFDLIYFRS